MKKILSVIIAVAVLMSCLVLGAGATEATLTAEEINLLKIQRADANSNGKYDTDDALKILSAAMGTIEEDEKYDVDSDGAVSVRDALVALKAAAGTSPVTNEELFNILNAKLNSVKNDEKGFTRTATATCTSMKITQTAEFSNKALGALMGDSMSCDNLEYNAYVEKMTGMLDEDKMTEEEIANKNAMEESAATYRQPKTETYIAAADNYYDHYKLFPREYKNIASELTYAEISTSGSVVYSMTGGKITITLRMPKCTYTTATFPDDPDTTPYGKIFNLVSLETSEGSTVKNAEFKNGKVTLVMDSATGEIQTVDYYYDYYSNVAAPEQVMTDATLGTITINMSTKTNANIKEHFEF